MGINYGRSDFKYCKTTTLNLSSTHVFVLPIRSIRSREALIDSAFCGRSYLDIIRKLLQEGHCNVEEIFQIYLDSLCTQCASGQETFRGDII